MDKNPQNCKKFFLSWIFLTTRSRRKDDYKDSISEILFSSLDTQTRSHEVQTDWLGLSQQLSEQSAIHMVENGLWQSPTLEQDNKRQVAGMAKRRSPVTHLQRAPRSAFVRWYFWIGFDLSARNMTPVFIFRFVYVSMEWALVPSFRKCELLHVSFVGVSNVKKVHSALHVHNVHRAVLTLSMFVSLVPFVKVLVQRVDNRWTNCL